jgi:hypothetical protein
MYGDNGFYAAVMDITVFAEHRLSYQEFPVFVIISREIAEFRSRLLPYTYFSILYSLTLSFRPRCTVRPFNCPHPERLDALYGPLIIYKFVGLGALYGPLILRIIPISVHCTDL